MANPPTEPIKDHDGELFFSSHNPSAPTTIVLLHGLFCSHHEWEHVIPQLQDYHVIVPDLPQHSLSREIQPFSLRFAAQKVASLIEKHAHGGKAHVVGLSLGGFVTMQLIRDYDQLVHSAFVSGANLLAGWQAWLSYRPSIVHWGFWFTISSGLYDVAARQTGLREHAALRKDLPENNTADLVQRAYADVGRWGKDDAREVGMKDKRIMLVAGGHGDYLDGAIQQAKILLEVGQKDGKRSCAYVVKQAIHGWDLQFPEVFAEGIKAWIEERPLPSEYETLL